MASSRLDRAVAIRDHVLPLINERGTRWPDEALRIITWQPKPLLFVFQTLAPESPKREPKFYELAVLCGGSRMMLLAWSEINTTELISFIPGEWEQKALATN